MQFPKLTPLQSRLAACLGTSIILIIIYFSLSPSHFAYAAELDSILNQDHNHHRIELGHDLDLANDIDWGEDGEIDLDTDAFADAAEYQAEFPGVSRQIIGRAPDNMFALQNNVPHTLNIGSGETNFYVFENVSIWGENGTPRTGLPTNISRADDTQIRRRDYVKNEEEDTVVLERQTDLPDEEKDEEGDVIMKRQAGGGTPKLVYISVNTCLQPSVSDGDTATPPQLKLYVSLHSNNQKPGPDSNDLEIPLIEGYASASVNATGDVYISVSAPNLPDNTFTGQWNYAIATSIDASYYYYNGTDPFLWTVDTDSNSALISTYNLTSEDATNETLALRKQWMKTTPPFSMFVYNQSSPLIKGISNSFCGLQKLDMGPITVEPNMTSRGFGQNPKQQFYIRGLQPGQTYLGVLAYNGINVTSNSNNGAIAGGGQVWQSMQFNTKSDGNCQLIFDLPFCDSVAYAVPTNPQNTTLDTTTLAQVYDNYTAALYKQFENTLQQVPCNTTTSAQFSLATNCTQCARDYKTWLCAVTIPRCTDFSTPNTTDFSFLVPRNIGQKFPNGTDPDLGSLGLSNSSYTNRIWANSSRNAMIDQVIKPGPYKELLPCKELCYDMVQSCPTALGFACPKDGGFAGGLLKRSYGSFDTRRIEKGGDGVLTCNFLGVDWPTLSSGSSLRVGGVWWFVVGGAIVWGLLG